MKSQAQEIAVELQKLPENKMTIEIIIPLLESLGYFKVEFHGGIDEHGKDILCWEKDRFGFVKLAVAQVKHFKFTGKASGNKSFQTVYNQLIQCFNESLPFADQTSHQPQEALLISTHTINTKILKSRLGGQIPIEKVTVIDGLKLAELLIEKRPDLVTKVMGLEADIIGNLESTLNNEILLQSIGYFEKKSIKHIYTDIDFSLGKKSTQLFFNSTFTPTVKTFFYVKTDWIIFKSHCANLFKEFSSDFLRPSLKECEEEAKLRKEETKEEKETFIIKVDGEILAQLLNNKKQWIENEAKKINDTGAGVNEIRTFIERCDNIFKITKIILSEKNPFFSVLFKNDQSIVRTNFESTRLKLPLEQVFDTGCNISVLGEAGAGKTTCLQMYTINKQKDTSRLNVYLPLSRVMQTSLRHTNLGSTRSHGVVELSIVAYLKESNVSITEEQFIHLLKTRKTTLLFDGIDEAIKIAPWLIQEIKNLAETYKENVQVITSSRTTGLYFDNIPFFNITLLPFTDEQKNKFISNWFGAERIEVSNKICKHLQENSYLNELVNNPLLTTILCVIGENELPLPNSEVKLYSDRLDLLTGYYDSMKRISRITTTPSILKTLAQKLAFYLHTKSKREANVSELEEITIESMKNITTSLISKNALEELIDPCNLLVPMSDDGKYGFGHLRFQEHLASMEILSNRSIEISTLIGQPWWRSVLVFFARINDDLTWFVQGLCIDKGMRYAKRDVIDEMVKCRPKNEQKRIKKIIDKFDMFEELNNK